jgi:N-acetylmuramoyl-L-alanine amidase
VQAENPPNTNWHKVTAKSGDGVFSLLRRYHLSEHASNIEKFYELNQIQKNTALLAGKKYQIPVLLYTYNGKSIRSTIGIDDWDKAVRIKQYNELLLASKLRKTKYTESKILWVPFHELTDALDDTTASKNDLKKEATSPATSNKTIEKKATITEKGKTYVPLFGKDYEEVQVVDTRLNDKVFYLVSGHGGPDPGARCTTCPSTLCEDEYAYDVTLRLARNLKQHGAIVHVIIQDPNDGIRDEKILKCDRDETCLNSGKIPLNQVARLRQRTKTINHLYSHYKQQGIKEQIAMMIHVDSRSASTRQDVFFYYYKGSKSSKKAAENLLTTFDKKYALHQKNRGYKGYVKNRNLFMLKYTYPTAVYVELANIRNKSDHRRLLLSSNRQALANWLFEGMLKSLNISKHEVTAP